MARTKTEGIQNATARRYILIVSLSGKACKCVCVCACVVERRWNYLDVCKSSHGVTISSTLGTPWNDGPDHSLGKPCPSELSCLNAVSSP